MCIRSQWTQDIVATLRDKVFPEDIDDLGDFVARLPEKRFAHPLALIASMVKADLIDDDDFRSAVRAIAPVIRSYAAFRRRQFDLFECQPQAAQSVPLADGLRHPASQGGTSKGVRAMFGRRNGHDSDASAPITGDTRFATTFAGEMALRKQSKSAAAPINERAMVNAGRAPAKPSRATPIMRSLADREAQSQPPRRSKFFAEIRTNAGKVKFRTPRGFDTAELAAAAAFRDGPQWARECLTYTGVQIHHR